MRRPMGYATVTDPDQPLVEYDTALCGHCQRILFTKPGSASTVYLSPTGIGQWREEPGAFCRLCMRAICLRCCDRGICVPWEQMIEAAESRQRFFRQVGI